MEDIETYIFDKILEEVPSFKEDCEYLDITKETGIYSFLGSFALFMQRNISINTKESMELVAKCYGIINDLAELDDDKLKNLITVGVLEILTDTVETQKCSFDLLTGRARSYYESLFPEFFNRLI
jgi:hypothetical protein